MHRRQFLATAPLAGLAAGTGAVPALAQGFATTGGQVPAVQRFAVGDITVTCLSDGSLHIGPDALIGIDAAGYSELMEAGFRDPDTFRSAVNAFVIQTGDETILVDAGTADAMGPDLGRLPENLAAAGIDPRGVTKLLATHLHPDHVAGALKGGDAAFPNAELVVNETDRTFWSDESNFSGAGEMVQGFASLARNVLSAYSDRLTTFSGEDEVAPGVTAMPLPGHTPGHSGYMIASGDAQLLIWADIVHVAPVQMARPDIAIGFDVDPGQAVETRRQILDRVATDRMMVAGSHIGFPGLVQIARDGDGYRMVPAQWDYSL
ncbi:MBL fold metallo-hydrolase [Roseivivax sediminis]|uniref:Glyoxylase, beta-lactamase superfamily II n=1 Tax=Roseivivax sediminis TaxID=936889 RepID=A0A1I2DTW3_9RHOB|nr:MBL fold metallo-hydrolase [Roseivivax sediminis]SFE83848.1 Glyoxylase, beta-lactamase superfamily II [Roseivivax sediminis]